MKFLRASLWPSLIATAVAASQESNIYIFEPGVSGGSAKPESIASDSAQYLLAQRLGFSSSFSLNNVNDRLLAILNKYGSQAQRLLGAVESTIQERGLIIVDGVSDIRDLIPDSETKYQRLAWSDNNGFDPFLFKEDLFLSPDATLEQDVQVDNYNDGQIGEVIRNIEGRDNTIDEIIIKGPSTLVHMQSLNELKKQHGTKSAFYKEMVANTRQAFADLLKLAQKENFSLTILLNPPTSKLSARDSTAKQQPELMQTVTGTATATSAPITTPPADNVTSPLTGRIPSCFSSREACKKGTRDCTGHGECAQKYKDCFGCLCNKPEVRKNKNGGVKTTQFGGNACQKKSVVMPFWLIAGITVGLMFVLSWGVGLLYTMGGEELPSVIGAGVSGPKART